MIGTATSAGNELIEYVGGRVQLEVCVKGRKRRRCRSAPTYTVFDNSSASNGHIWGPQQRVLTRVVVLLPAHLSACGESLSCLVHLVPARYLTSVHADPAARIRPLL